MSCSKFYRECNESYKNPRCYESTKRWIVLYYRIVMKLSPFMKEHKKNLKTRSKKRLIKQILFQTDIMAHKEIENDSLNKILTSTEQHLRSAESALDYKEVVIDKYKKLLETSVEHL